MNNTEIQILRTNIQAQLTNKLVSPLCLAGEPGTAKSTTVELVAKELNMNIVTCSGPILSHEALSGLPDTVDAAKFQANSIDGSVPKATLWSIPEIMAQTLRAAETKPTVLLIDDFHMVSPHLQAYFYGLLLERRLGNYKLSDNVALILTMNDSEAAGFNGINSAVRNRMSILKIEFNFEHWFGNYGNRLHYMVSSFLKAKSHYCQEPETTSIEGYATARAWTSIAAELSAHTDSFVQANAKRVSGMQVSGEASTAFQSHVNYVAAIDFTKVVASRELVNLASRDPLDSIIFAYITNFIHTIDDGMYLLDLMDINSEDTSSAFIGFLIGELYIKFTHSENLSEGLRYIIDRLLSANLDPTLYPNTSKEKLTKAFAKPIPKLSSFQEKAHEYLL